MKNTIKISVKKPCSEKFSNFSKTEKGGFCASCEKEVVDFTNMPQTEVLKHLCESENGICGKFNTSQLGEFKHYSTPSTMTNYISKGIGAMSFSLLSLCAMNTMEAQEANANIHLQTDLVMGKSSYSNTINQDATYQVKGVVIDETNSPLPGVSVVLKGTTDGVVTDIDGKFEFMKPLKKGDELVFSYIGYQTIKHTVTNNKADNLNIAITFNAEQIELMGEIAIEGVYKPKRNLVQKIGDIF
ncbi:carboxypeptidase-like regulatory domain-containing protein [Cellulophaga sp. HaHaR_3_176]|uniref:carboxypeptidase-like regulatory domain-containing protein n=1 Tax=Cellulophaga sp. HaHaR_3_176 TaxID=1942464 RepID=UPI001C1F5525|nr:carboxypeptidase-like regulatory domain-containing protein [Cellulophaga sp. HaHaR_3_176]QWX82962.1 carboxypeptidase-like regulatory domain-containing protein [Cellulophaga sp. HaHaR_3_176]